MLDQIAQDYQDEVTFLAVAGRSSFDASAERAPQLFDEERILWGYDDALWDRYEVFSQPTIFLISGDDVVVDGWFGEQSPDVIRQKLDALVLVG